MQNGEWDLDVRDEHVQVTSKGLGAQRLALVEDPKNLYWRAVRGHDVPRVAAKIAGELGASRVGVFGEGYGDGVQDLGYGAASRRTRCSISPWTSADSCGGWISRS